MLTGLPSDLCVNFVFVWNETINVLNLIIKKKTVKISKKGSKNSVKNLEKKINRNPFDAQIIDGQIVGINHHHHHQRSHRNLIAN